MKLLILSFYYPPDLSAGSFRVSALVKALLEQLPDGSHIDVITTLPNRYSSFSGEAPEVEDSASLTIRRIKLPTHQSGMLDQAKAFMCYARRVRTLVRKEKYQLVFATSSRLMSAALGAYVARRQRIPLYLDIRDIFVDTINDVLPNTSAALLTPLFSLVERWTLGRADKINLVSRGFEEYFLHHYPGKHYSYYSNGIDQEFIDAARGVVPRQRVNGAPAVVLYAGNMGEGQGLHAIVPELSKRLEGKVIFRLIGDGGRRARLEARLRELGCDNVEILPPVKRDQLLQHYQQADVLFLHLNDYPAFKKVLPSKLFEYAAMGKPVWAGVSGYAAEFVRAEIENSAVFPPCDAGEAERVFGGLCLVHTVRSGFIERYDRRYIAQSMARDVLSLRPDHEHVLEGV